MDDDCLSRFCKSMRHLRQERLRPLLLQGLFVEMFARVWYTWLVGRVLMGFAQGSAQAGLLTVCRPSTSYDDAAFEQRVSTARTARLTLKYLSEMAPTQVRGMVTAGYAIGWSMGNLVSGVGLYVISLVSSSCCIVCMTDCSTDQTTDGPQ